jgi:hypothetical protein
MKAIITGAKWIKEYESKFGPLHQHKIEYAGKTAWYSSKVKDQKHFIVGQEVEFTEIEQEGKNGKYTVIKPIQQSFNSGFGRQLKREQSKYSGMATSYVKDLIIVGKIELKDWEALSRKVCQWMVNFDKEMLD